MKLCNELLIKPFMNGIKLHKSSSAVHSSDNLSNLMKLSCSVYFESSDGIIRLINERNAEYCWYDSAINAVGKCYFDLLPKQFSKSIRMNDEFVMENGTRIFDEINYDKNIQPIHTLSIKAPWYDENKKVIGLFGISMVSGIDSLSEPLIALSKLGLLNENIHNKTLSHIKLSKRQLECARFISQGMTSKEIAQAIGLSPRTVEYYIDNIKNRLNCRNKTELIMKLSRILN